jgi:hypothetical protein
VNWGDCLQTGVPTRAAINSLKFRIQDKNSTPITVHFQELALIAGAHERCRLDRVRRRVRLDDSLRASVPRI